ncbi:MAG: hypothetical protein NTZ80_03500 [Patescibacteria group bacterium]|nr:hypothetical protein [Patescibacteria group bacterium]
MIRVTKNRIYRIVCVYARLGDGASGLQVRELNAILQSGDLQEAVSAIDKYIASYVDSRSKYLAKIAQINGALKSFCDMIHSEKRTPPLILKVYFYLVSLISLTDLERGEIFDTAQGLVSMTERIIKPHYHRISDEDMRAFKKMLLKDNLDMSSVPYALGKYIFSRVTSKCLTPFLARRFYQVIFCKRFKNVSAFDFYIEIVEKLLVELFGFAEDYWLPRPSYV